MEKHNTVHAIFASGAKIAEIKDDVWQHDFGQTLQIEGLSLPPTVEVHYANKGRDTAIPQVGVTKDGITTAPIPNEILGEKGAFTAYIFVTDGESGETCYTINGYVNKRPPVKDYSTPEEQEILHAAVGAVNAAAERAESAETKATAAANQTAKDAKQTATDREAVKLMVESVSGIGEQVKKVEECTRQSQEAATQAGKAEEAAVAAKTSAEAAAQKTAEDKQAVELAKTEVDKAQKAVSEDRTAVETVRESVEQLGNAIPEATQTGVQAVDQAKQTAVNEIAQTGNTHKTAVEAAGTKAVEEVNNSKGEALKAIETAKTEAVKAVQTEGTTQTANITAEGTKQLTVVQKAAQEIVADREQIKANKADIAGIKEEMDNLSSVIINSAAGEAIVVEDSSGSRFKGLSLYGKSTQVTTTGAQLLDINNLMSAGGFNNTATVVDGGLSKRNNDVNVPDRYLIDVIPNTVYSLSALGFVNGAVVQISDALQKGENDTVVDARVFDGIKHVTFKKYEQLTLSFFSTQLNTAFRADHIMLNTGSSALPWESYTGGKPSPSIEFPQEIENVGDSGSINIEVASSNLINYYKAVPNASGAIRYDGNRLYYKRDDHTSGITVQGGATWIVNLRKGNVYINISRSEIVRIYKGNVFEIGYSRNNRIYNSSSNKHTINIPEDGIYTIGLWDDLDNTEKYIDYINVNYLPEQTGIGNYEEPQILNISAQNGLRGLPVTYGNGNYSDETRQQWVCDEIDLERGKYIQRVEKTDLKGLKWSDSWNKKPSYYIEGTFLVYSPNFNCEPKGKAKPLSNKFRYVNNILRDPTTGMDTRQGGGRNIAFRVPVSIAENVEQWTEFVNNNDIEVIYALETPIEHDLPPEVIEAYKKLHTNYPVTTIMNDEGAGMKVEYVADTKLYVDHKIANGLAAMLRGYEVDKANLLSLMPDNVQAAMIENDANRILESEVTK